MNSCSSEGYASVNAMRALSVTATDSDSSLLQSASPCRCKHFRGKT